MHGATIKKRMKLGFFDS